MMNFLLKTRVDFPFDKKDFNYFVEKSISQRMFTKVFTVNPEFIVDAFYDSNFRSVLNSSNLNSADGIGVVLALKFKEHNKKYKTKLKAFLKTIEDIRKNKLISQRLTGVDITSSVLNFANENRKSLFILGGDPQKKIDERMTSLIKSRYPKINLVGASSFFSYKRKDDKDTISFIHQEMKKKNLIEIDFLLVAYGHKNQEFWIERNQKNIPALFAVGVGGTFDFLTNEIKRAPIWIQNIGLEWFYRLIKQPSRIFRIFKATFLFISLLILQDK